VPAEPAVVGVVGEIRLAAIAIDAVAVSKSGLAHENGTVAARAASNNGIGNCRTDATTSTAVVGIGLQVRLTPICRIVIAVREAGIADSQTHAI
jgi:hypothetical protein